MLLFVLALIGSALIAIVLMPALLWWALHENGEDLAATTPRMIFDRAVWQAFVPWRRKRFPLLARPRQIRTSAQPRC